MRTFNPPINPKRLFHALSRIGYDPNDAILDIVDNSVSAGATRIDVSFVLDRIAADSGLGRRRTELKEIVITDNGCGMDEDGLINALALGSSSDGYSDDTLSKFGLGLKSAAGSLGTRMVITSKTSVSQTHQVILDLAKIDREYVAQIGEVASAREFPSNQGTIIAISDLLVALPLVRLERELEHLIGLTYRSFIEGRERQAKIVFTFNGKEVQPVDPLFENLAEDRDLGNPDDWDGLAPSWIVRRTPIQIDGSHQMTFSAMTLPHPPLVGVTSASGLTQAECRNKFLIEAGTYGVYIYRNDRLIARADSLGGLVTRDQSHYAFRGRLDVTSDSDEVLSLNVQKNRIQLSPLAEEQIGEKVKQALKQARAAWESAARRHKDITGNSEKTSSDLALDQFAREELREDQYEEKTADPAERERLEAVNKKLQQRSGLNEEERERVERGQQRVQYEKLPNNRLWARRQGIDLGVVCVVNDMHRLVRDVLQDKECSAEVRRSLEYLLFIIVSAEAKVLRSKVEQFEKVDAIFEELSESAGELLSALLRANNPLRTPGEASD